MSDVYRTFSFTADTIDGKIQQFPKQFYLRCGQVTPIGAQTVRQYTGTECIQAMNVFVIYYNGQLLGSKCFRDVLQFLQYFKSVCEYNYFLLNGCYMTINGCQVSI